MRIVCTICTDAVTEDFAASPCGHTFHFTCLSQWLTHQKTCPQCRLKCLPRNVLKLFIDSNESSITDGSDGSQDPGELKEKLDLQGSLLKHKDQALTEARTTLEQIRREMHAWQSQHSSTHKKLKSEQAANSALKKQMCLLQYESDQAKEAKREVHRLRDKLSTMASLHKVLTDSSEEVETLVKNYSSPVKLATFVVAMKRDYEVLKASKLAVQREKDKLAQDASYVRKQLRCREQDLASCRSQMSAQENDLHAAEQERENLQKKVEMLERALESPGSRLALRRILESPMPENTKGRPADLGASPLLVSQPHKHGQAEMSLPLVDMNKVPPLGMKRTHSNDTVLLPVSKVSKKSTSQNFASGFNGMGGQAKFTVPKPKPRAVPKPASKGLKFAPRHLSQPRPKPAHALPALHLKF